MNTLAQLVCSRVRAKVFSLLFCASPASLHLREIQRRSGFALGTVRQDIEKLVKMELVLRRKDGNRMYYAANEKHPLFPEIRGLVLKTSGLADVLKQALNVPSILCAFVFGSIAQGTATAESDVDLMVIGEISLRKITGLLSGTGNHLGREINSHVLSLGEFSKRWKAGEHFVASVMAAPKIWMIGSEDELRAMGK